MRYRISDGNCGFNHDNWMDVVIAAEEWYWQRDDMQSSSTEFSADYGYIREDDIDGLNAAISDFEKYILAVRCNRDPNDYNLSVELL